MKTAIFVRKDTAIQEELAGRHPTFAEVLWADDNDVTYRVMPVVPSKKGPKLAAVSEIYSRPVEYFNDKFTVDSQELFNQYK